MFFEATYRALLKCKSRSDDRNGGHEVGQKLHYVDVFVAVLKANDESERLQCKASANECVVDKYNE